MLASRELFPMLQSPSVHCPCVPSDATLTRVVVPEERSRTKTSGHPFVSPATRLLAKLLNVTKRPSAEIPGAVNERSLPCVPSDATLTRIVRVPPGSSKTPLPSASRSCTKVSSLPFVSPGTRLSHWLSKATKRPSAEIDGRLDPGMQVGKQNGLMPSPSEPSDATLTRIRLPLVRS